MKIFATSDIHGNKQIICKLITAYENSEAELLLVCGDIGGKGYRAHTLKELGKRQRQDYDYLINELTKCSKPFRCILGNDDWFDVDDGYCLATDGKLNDIIAFDFVHITPFNTNREMNENQLAYQLGKLEIGNNSIVMAHCPPHGFQDKIQSGTRVGSKSIKDCITRLQPKIWLCGHIHEDFGFSKIGETLVINCACDHLKDRLRGFIVDTNNMQCDYIDV